MACLILLLWAAPPSQEKPITAESIVARYIEAKGGRKALEKVKNYVIKGTWSSSGRLLGRFESYQAQNRYLSIERFPDGSERRHGTDGKIAWIIGVDGKPKILTGQQGREYIRHNSTLHEALEWKRQFKKIEYAGKKKVGDATSHQLVFHTKGGHKTTRFFDAKTGLFVSEERVLADAKRTQLVSTITDYRKLNGMLVSHRRVNRYSSDFAVEFSVKSLHANSIKDMSVFAIPKSVAELAKEKSRPH